MRDGAKHILLLCEKHKTRHRNKYHKYMFTAAAHTRSSVFISHNDTWAVTTQITVTRQRLPKPFTLSLVAGHRALTSRLNDLLMAELVKQGMIRES